MIKHNDIISFKIPSNYAMNKTCIDEINKKKGKIGKIFKSLVNVELLQECKKCGFHCKYITIEIKYVKKN